MRPHGGQGGWGGAQFYDAISQKDPVYYKQWSYHHTNINIAILFLLLLHLLGRTVGGNGGEITIIAIIVVSYILSLDICK